MLEVLGQDYVRTARAKGLGGWAVVVRHALKNALIPVITIFGLQFGNLLAGAVIVETVFSRPGLGRLLVGGILAKDFPLVQGTVLFVATTYVLINVLVDIAYGLVDPRIHSLATSAWPDGSCDTSRRAVGLVIPALALMALGRPGSPRAIPSRPCRAMPSGPRGRRTCSAATISGATSRAGCCTAPASRSRSGWSRCRSRSRPARPWASCPATMAGGSTR
jgi:hypothetical protein